MAQNLRAAQREAVPTTGVATTLDGLCGVGGARLPWEEVARALAPLSAASSDESAPLSSRAPDPPTLCVFEEG